MPCTAHPCPVPHNVHTSLCDGDITRSVELESCVYTCSSVRISSKHSNFHVMIKFMPAYLSSRTPVCNFVYSNSEQVHLILHVRSLAYANIRVLVDSNIPKQWVL